MDYKTDQGARVALEAARGKKIVGWEMSLWGSDLATVKLQLDNGDYLIIEAHSHAYDDCGYLTASLDERETPEIAEMQEPSEFELDQPAKTQ
jgi:hypothetical protein